jgi:ATP-dependent protease HslVU (ClpYQ) peptidase subunit
MSRKKAKRLICTVHDEIMQMCEDLTDEWSEKLNKRELKKLDKIYKLAEEAKLYGESMEGRLIEYKEGIEEIGFLRVK